MSFEGRDEEVDWLVEHAVQADLDKFVHKNWNPDWRFSKQDVTGFRMDEILPAVFKEKIMTRLEQLQPVSTRFNFGAQTLVNHLSALLLHSIC